MLPDHGAAGCVIISPRCSIPHGAAPAPTQEPRGCLFALSQPPLMIFLAVIGVLLLMAAVHDLFVL
ncbi:hypothetical protein ACFQ60_12750 [Streptomyces zhihengii]